MVYNQDEQAVELERNLGSQKGSKLFCEVTDRFPSKQILHICKKTSIAEKSFVANYKTLALANEKKK